MQIVAHALRQHADPAAGRRSSSCRSARSRGCRFRASESGDGLGRRYAETLFRAERRRRSWAICSATISTSIIYQVLLNAKASEQSARMVSMKNATDNAEA